MMSDTYIQKKLHHKKVKVGDANKIRNGLGLGLFAKRNITKGERIFIIKGKELYLKINNSNDSKRYPRAIGIERGHWINPRTDNPLFFTNHSCEPNAGFKGKKTIVALRNIKKEEHITIDYGTTEEDTLWSMKCACGSKKCRKIIRSIQYLPKENFNQYFPNISTYFRTLYLKK